MAQLLILFDYFSLFCPSSFYQMLKILSYFYFIKFFCPFPDFPYVFFKYYIWNIILFV
jgi:hypothetical protein